MNTRFIHKRRAASCANDVKVAFELPSTSASGMCFKGGHTGSLRVGDADKQREEIDGEMWGEVEALQCCSCSDESTPVVFNKMSSSVNVDSSRRKYR